MAGNSWRIRNKGRFSRRAGESGRTTTTSSDIMIVPKEKSKNTNLNLAQDVRDNMLNMEQRKGADRESSTEGEC